MPRVIMQGLKAWYDDRSGRYNYTPEMQIAPDFQPLDAAQMEQIDRDFEAMRAVLVGVIARFGALDAQDHEAKMKALKAEAAARQAAKAAEIAAASCPYPVSSAPDPQPARAVDAITAKDANAMQAKAAQIMQADGVQVRTVATCPPDSYIPKAELVPDSIKAQLAEGEKPTYETTKGTWGATISKDGAYSWRPLVQPDGGEVLPEKPAQVQRTVEGTDLPQLPMVAYDAAKRCWNFCPDCDNTEVTHVSKAGKEYQACKRCRQWLESDGRKKPMGAR